MRDKGLFFFFSLRIEQLNKGQNRLTDRGQNEFEEESYDFYFFISSHY